MSGGSHNYQFYQLNDYVESMKKYDPELAEMMADVVTLCHDIEWFESGDYSYEDLEASMQRFKRSWMEATPEMQHRVQRSILQYCEQLEHYAGQLRQSVFQKGYCE